MKIEYYPALGILVYNGQAITEHTLRLLVSVPDGDLLMIARDGKDRVTVITVTHGAPPAPIRLRGRIVTRTKREGFFSQLNHHHHSPQEVTMTSIALSWSNPTTRSDTTPLPPGAIKSVVIVRTPQDGSDPAVFTVDRVDGQDAPTSYVDKNVADGAYAYQAYAVSEGGQAEGSNVFEVQVGVVIQPPPPAETIPPAAITGLAGVAQPDAVA